MNGEIKMNDSIIEIITEILVENYGCKRDEITADTRFQDIWVDSLDVAEMVGEIEDRIGYEVELTERIETVGELAEFIENCKED